MGARVTSYDEHISRLLKSRKDVETYLNAALEEEDPRAFLIAMRNVVKVYGGFTTISKETGLNREHLYRAFSKRGNPTFDSLNSLMNAIGFKVRINRDTKSKTKLRPGKFKGDMVLT